MHSHSKAVVHFRRVLFAQSTRAGLGVTRRAQRGSPLPLPPGQHKTHARGHNFKKKGVSQRGKGARQQAKKGARGPPLPQSQLPSVQAVAGHSLEDATGHGCIGDHHARLLRLLQHPLHQLRLRVAHHCGGWERVGEAGGQEGAASCTDGLAGWKPCTLQTSVRMQQHRSCEAAAKKNSRQPQ